MRLLNVSIAPALGVLALLASLAPVAAQNWNSTQVGPYTFYNGTDRNGGMWNGTSNQVGNYRYYNFNGPGGQTTNCTQNRVGAYTYTNCN